jgi:hypothetical protein
MRELRALSRRCDLTEAGLNEAAATALRRGPSTAATTSMPPQRLRSIRKRKKPRLHPLSCKIDYLPKSNHRHRLIASEFFMGDYGRRHHPRRARLRKRRNVQCCPRVARSAGIATAIQWRAYWVMIANLRIISELRGERTRTYFADWLAVVTTLVLETHWLTARAPSQSTNALAEPFCQLAAGLVAKPEPLRAGSWSSLHASSQPG